MERTTAIPVLWGLLAVAVLVGLTLRTRRDFPEETTAARRILWQFFGGIAVPLALVFGAVLALAALFLDIEAAVWGPLVAGLFIATGWLTTAIFAEVNRTRERAERLRDYHKALFAEIRNALAAIDAGGRGEEEGREVLRRMEADVAFVPFVPRERHDHIYDAIVDEIEVLPRQTIDAIVAYYSLIKSVGSLAEDLRGEGFRGLPQARRITLYGDYLATRREAFEIGEYALALILAYAEGGPEAADRRAAEFSSRAAGRSGPSSGSE